MCLPVFETSCRVACILLVGLACAVDPGSARYRSTALASLQATADSGEAPAQLLLGERLQAGFGMPRDEAAGARRIREAAAQGLARVQYVLGTILLTGRGVPGDTSAALVWLRKAAKQGVVDAEYALGRALIDSGHVDRPGHDRGVAWIRKAAESSSRLAQVRLADMLASGLGLAPDIPAAMDWYRRAAGHGSVRAHWRLRGERSAGFPNDKVTWSVTPATTLDTERIGLGRAERPLAANRTAAAERRGHALDLMHSPLRGAARVVGGRTRLATAR